MIAIETMNQRVVVNDRMQRGYLSRHVAPIRNHCERGDFQCRRKQRQAVLHWAYDARKI